MRYACDVCGERFFVHGHMKRHLYSHTGIKPHACRWKCGAIFASYGGRMKHERAQHSENPYKLDCDICGRPFRYVHIDSVKAPKWYIFGEPKNSTELLNYRIAFQYKDLADLKYFSQV